MGLEEYRGVYVFAQQVDNELSGIAFELLGKAKDFNYIDRDCIDAMKEKGTVWVPTLVTTGNLLGCGRYPQEELEKIFDSARANVSCAWEKGVLLAAGSDAGAYMVLHGQGLLDEYQIFCDLFGETEELKNRLKEGESVIRRKFQAEKVWKLTSKSTIIDAASAS